MISRIKEYFYNKKMFKFIENNLENFCYIQQQAKNTKGYSDIDFYYYVGDGNNYCSINDSKNILIEKLRNNKCFLEFNKEKYLRSFFVNISLIKEVKDGYIIFKHKRVYPEWMGFKENKYYSIRVNEKEQYEVLNTLMKNKINNF